MCPPDASLFLVSLQFYSFEEVCLDETLRYSRFKTKHYFILLYFKRLRETCSKFMQPNSVTGPDGAVG